MAQRQLERQEGMGMEFGLGNRCNDRVALLYFLQLYEGKKGIDPFFSSLRSAINIATRFRLLFIFPWTISFWISTKHLLVSKWNLFDLLKMTSIFSSPSYTTKTRRTRVQVLLWDLKAFSSFCGEICTARLPAPFCLNPLFFVSNIFEQNYWLHLFSYNRAFLWG